MGKEGARTEMAVLVAAAMIASVSIEPSGMSGVRTDALVAGEESVTRDGRRSSRPAT